MDFIVNNWLWFLLAAVIFIALALANMLFMFTQAEKANLSLVNFFLHMVFGLGYGGCLLMFIIGAVVHIIRYANKS